MTLDEAQQRILDRMTPSERAVFDHGCKVVDWYMDVALNKSLPQSARDAARDKLRAFAHRQPHETVADIDGKPNA